MPSQLDCAIVLLYAGLVLPYQADIKETMKQLIKFFTFAIFTAGLIASSHSATTQEAPDELIKRVSHEVIAIAKSDKQIQSGNRQRIVELVETKILPYTDFPRATALVTGRHWRTATPQQREQLIEEFRKLLLYTYAGAMSQVRDQQIDVKPLRNDVTGDDVIVDSEFRKSPGAEPIQVSYRLAKSADGWKIYDVNVMGVWLGLTYRETFANEINKGGVDGLIQTLSEKNKLLRTKVETRPARNS